MLHRNHLVDPPPPPHTHIVLTLYINMGCCWGGNVPAWDTIYIKKTDSDKT